MRTLENLINNTKGIIVVLLFLIGSITEVHMPVVVTLVSMLAVSVGALIFFVRAKKRYIETRTLDRMVIQPEQKKKDSSSVA